MVKSILKTTFTRQKKREKKTWEKPKNDSNKNGIRKRERRSKNKKADSPESQWLNYYLEERINFFFFIQR